MIDTSKTTMKAIKVPFTDVPQFSKKDVAYVTEDPKLREFYKYAVGLEAFEQVIKDKQKDNTDREVLVKILRQQYSKLEVTAVTRGHIEALLEDNTFTLITAHQPSLFTGPLYYIYKIISVINLSQKLATHYPEFQFVPVFITGGEDHDFEEVNHVHLFNKTLEWKNEESGSVGMMSTKSLESVLVELKEILGDSERAAKVYELMSVTHSRHDQYSDAVIDMVNEIFGPDGLVIVNMNHPGLKRLFIPEIKKEIFENPSIDLVGKERDKLEAIGFKPQAFPREINFFYLRDQIRERITLSGDHYEVLNTDYIFTKEELEQEIDNHPERFSPNVIMRPLYQEKVFPNLAYIGGGGEIAYWLERKTQFEYFGINFPMLIRRDSVLWVDKGSMKKMDKLELNIHDFFQKEDDIIRKFVEGQASEEITLADQKTKLAEIFDEIAELAKAIDPTVAKAIQAEHTKQQKVIDQLESRIHRAEKHKHDTAINQIRSVKDKLFPKDGLQERYDNFMGFYFMYGESFLDTLKEHLDPLEKNMTIILDER
jgi:bacillithiol biosynthesis cysteine-adding enzyme BshC